MAWTVEESRPVVAINGEEIPVDPDQPFARTVKQIAQAKGLHRFTVLVDGEEITPGQAPENFEGISRVEIKKYDEAG